MPFKPGQKRPEGSGRKKGQISRDRQMLLDKARDLGVDPFEILLRFAAADWRGLGYEEEGQTVHTAGGGSFYQRTIEPELRAKCAADACQYILPRLKALDVNMSADDGPINVTFNLAGADASNKPKPAGADPAAAPAIPKP